MSANNCMNLNLPLCLACREPTGFASLDRCQVEFFGDMLTTYGTTEEEVKNYIVHVITDVSLIHGLSNITYLHKAIQINCPEYLHVYNKLCPLF